MVLSVIFFTMKDCPVNLSLSLSPSKNAMDHGLHYFEQVAVAKKPLISDNPGPQEFLDCPGDFGAVVSVPQLLFIWLYLKIDLRISTVPF